MNSIQIGRYRHYKCKEYTVIGVARHSETEEELVVYRKEYGNHGLWVRPKAMFIEMLFQHGVNFNDLPSWQKRGMGVYWKEYDKSGENSLTGERVTARRRRLRRDLELPMGDAYSIFVRQFLGQKVNGD